MNEGFTPSFADFQDDIEQYIISMGKSEKTSNGMTVFHGYNKALNIMFHSYLNKKIYDHLVAHFRQWNWEVGDNHYLLELSSALQRNHERHLLQTLWDSVLAKRQRLYNEMRRKEKNQPGKISLEQVENLRELLLATLNRLEGFAGDLGTDEDGEKYARIKDQITRNQNV